MGKDSTFDDMRPRTPRASALRRERIAMEQMSKLLEHRSEDDFAQAVEKAYGIKRGTQQYEEIAVVWRSLVSLSPGSR
jgi:hypothetical protein